LTLERRPAATDDDPFLRALFASAHPELAVLGDDIVDLQVRAQRREWEARFPGSTDETILLDGRPVGRLWVAWEPDACVLVDMVLLPEHRRTGIGTRVVGEVLAEADRRGVPTRVTVERANAPSLAFCAARGFVEVGGDALRIALERPVSPARPPRASL
jgi:GNAT superfamily N-acetyltransferase